MPAPVKRVVVGPLLIPSRDNLHATPEHPLPLHLCLGLRAWPPNQIVLDEIVTDQGTTVEIVPCMPGCEEKLLVTDAELQDDDAAGAARTAATAQTAANVATAAATASASAYSANWDQTVTAESSGSSSQLTGLDVFVPQSETMRPSSPRTAPSSASASAVSSVPVLFPPMGPPTYPPSAPAIPATSDALVGARSSRTTPLRPPSPLPPLPPPISVVSSPSAPTSAPAAIPATTAAIPATTAAIPATSDEGIGARSSRASPPPSLPPSVPVVSSPSAARVTQLAHELEQNLAHTVRYLQDAVEATDSWLAHLRSFQPIIPNDQNIQLQAPTVERGAKALLEAAKQVASGRLADALDDDVELLYFQESSFHFHSPSFEIGQAMMVTDDLHWIPTPGEGFYTPFIPGTPFSNRDITYFKACGIMLRLALLWEQDIMPVSPMLLALLIGGPEAGLDTELARVVMPSLASRLASWPPPVVQDSMGRQVYDVHLGQDPMNLIMETIPNVQSMHVRNLTPEGAAEFGKKLVASVLFQTPDVDHPFFEALRNGLNHPTLTRWGSGTNASVTTLLQTFDGRPVQQIVAGLFAARRPTSYAAIIPLLDSTVIVAEDQYWYNAELSYENLAHSWMRALQRYLAGNGHPDPTMVSGLPSEVQNLPALLGDAFRSTLFLKAISDSYYLPRDALIGRIKFMIKFTCFLPRNALVSFHTCTMSMDVVLNSDIAAIVERDLPDDPSEATDFDRYIHSLLLSSLSDYNTL
ncbi:hypothetical protein FKP32DRAFT_1601949 [Trametes sanguinea]|nr:hypothetical protein FKP32DRAFT_1601949 [Trametes sanguinea]